MLAVVLAAVAFRFAAPFDAPPGWRDDELIEFDMDARIRDGWRPLYITEAEGHEPLYHYLHAATIAAFGENIASYKWLPMACGALTVALTYALARRLFGARVALVAAALMAVSFWPILYARLGVRHIGLLPWMMGAYLAVAGLASGEAGRRPPPGHSQIRVWRRLLQSLAGGVCLAAGLATYFAGRVTPIVVLAFAVYLLLVHRAVFRRAWIGMLLVLATGAALALPMFVEIIRLQPGGEQRLEVVAPQLAELGRGDFRPVLETTIGTLGMFTFKGDPEALYNIEGRPVFDALTGAFFYVGVLLALWRWRRVEHGFVLIAFGLGIAPAWVSKPPGSFSHTIAAMPFVYVLTALGLVFAVERVLGARPTLQGERRKALVFRFAPFVLIVAFNGFLASRDYFGVWPQESYVRFLYHAPIRDVARWLDDNPHIREVAIATHPNYLRLDPLALRLDMKRDDVRARWFDSRFVAVYPENGGVSIGTPLTPLGKWNSVWAACCALAQPGTGVVAWESAADRFWDQAHLSHPALFGGQLALLGVDLDVYDQVERDSADGTLWLSAAWRVERAGLPATLKTFVHLVDAEGHVLSQFDDMGVYLPSLHGGDRFVQFIGLQRPATQPARYSLRIGLYDSATHARWLLPDGREFVTVELP